MSWYYTTEGNQHGPVQITELQNKIASSQLPADTLVWREGMTDWAKASTVPELSSTHAPTPDRASLAPSSNSPTTVNPDAPPTADHPVRQTDSDGIPPSPIPLDIGFCIKQGWRITNANLGIIIGFGAVYLACIFAFSLVTSSVATMIDGPEVVTTFTSNAGSSTFARTIGEQDIFRPASFVADILNEGFGMFLGLGATCFGLNLIGGRQGSITDMFSQRDKFWRSVGASILYMLMVTVGLLLLIIPGIYLALKFLFYQTAIVEKDLGVIESLSYSAELTRDNKLSLFALVILSSLIVILGFIAVVVGLIWAIPTTWLATLIAYRYLHKGEEAVQATLP